jgi:hypothetical protein
LLTHWTAIVATAHALKPGHAIVVRRDGAIVPL